jgi:hypothetical protein
MFGFSVKTCSVFIIYFKKYSTLKYIVHTKGIPAKKHKNDAIAKIGSPKVPSSDPLAHIKPKIKTKIVAIIGNQIAENVMVIN